MKSKRGAFTLFELMIVIVTIGILAAMVVPRFASAQSDTKVTAAGEDILGMAKAVEVFNANNGYWPEDVDAGQMPPEIRSQFKKENPFEKICPIGGVYDYSKVTAGGKTIVSITVGSAFYGSGPSIVDAQSLDTYLDDGVLNKGKFQSTSAGYTYIFDTH